MSNDSYCQKSGSEKKSLTVVSMNGILSKGVHMASTLDTSFVFFIYDFHDEDAYDQVLMYFENYVEMKGLSVINE